ncbi:MAG: response regulator [Candidatus Omnitrophota bacterium]|jgi:CheY-like chemotaxis protein
MSNQKIALVIDDDQGVVNSVKLILREELNYLALGATNPETAVDLAKHYSFDLLILDLHMPKLDGFEVLELVRKKQPLVKVVVITGLYEHYQERFAQVKVDKIIEKPIEPARFARDIVAVAGQVDLPVIKDAGKTVKAKILVVDDEEEFCEAFKEWLTEDASLSQYEVEIAQDGREGITMNNQFEPDIVFFDIKMPHMNGLEMVECIKKGNGHKPRLFVALTADAFQNVLEDIKSQGYMVFSKPFRIEQVLEYLREKCLDLGLYKTA